MNKFFFRFITALLIHIGFSTLGFGQLSIHHLTGNFYVYTTFGNVDGSPFPSNSMYMVTDASVVMFDTPWDSTQFQPLLDSIEFRHHKPVVLCIATHFHSDRTAGLDFLNHKGIPTYSSRLTFDLCKEHHDHQPVHFFVNDTTFNIGDESFETFYGGQGHTADNIVIWFGRQKILYGGCLIKSKSNASLGNVEDANISLWPATLEKIMKKYPDPKYVIPGHFNWGGKELLKHTLSLLRQNNRKK